MMSRSIANLVAVAIGAAACGATTAPARSPTPTLAATGPSSASPHGMAHGMAASPRGMCESRPSGADLAVTDVPGGVAIAFTTTGDVAELRRWVHHMASMHEHGMAHGGDHATEHSGDHATEHSGDHATEHSGDPAAVHGEDHATAHGGDHAVAPGGEHGGDHATAHGGDPAGATGDPASDHKGKHAGPHGDMALHGGMGASCGMGASGDMGSHGGMESHGGMGSHGSHAMAMVPSTATAEDVDGGARIVLVPHQLDQLEALREHARAHASRDCAMSAVEQR
jgi:hypothetical protein